MKYLKFCSFRNYYIQVQSGAGGSNRSKEQNCAKDRSLRVSRFLSRSNKAWIHIELTAKGSSVLTQAHSWSNMNLKQGLLDLNTPF